MWDIKYMTEKPSVTDYQMKHSNQRTSDNERNKQIVPEKATMK